MLNGLGFKSDFLHEHINSSIMGLEEDIVMHIYKRAIENGYCHETPTIKPCMKNSKFRYLEFIGIGLNMANTFFTPRYLLLRDDVYHIFASECFLRVIPDEEYVIHFINTTEEILMLVKNNDNNDVKYHEFPPVKLLCSKPLSRTHAWAMFVSDEGKILINSNTIKPSLDSRTLILGFPLISKD